MNNVFHNAGWVSLFLFSVDSWIILEGRAFSGHSLHLLYRYRGYRYLRDCWEYGLYIDIEGIGVEFSVTTLALATYH